MASVTARAQAGVCNSPGISAGANSQIFVAGVSRSAALAK